MSKEIIEGNKLIAEFMGYKLRQRKSLMFKYWEKDITDEFGKDVEVLCSESKLKYHCDWNLLMPVVEIINVVFGYASTELSNTSREQERLSDPLDNPDCWKSWSYHSIHPITEDINSVWNRVVRSITWYNQQNT